MGNVVSFRGTPLSSLAPRLPQRRRRVQPGVAHESLHSVVVVFLLHAVAFSQETTRSLEGPGQFTKFLTPGLRDEWTFKGEKDETLIVHAATRDFDSILGLALVGDKGEKELFPEVNDPGATAASPTDCPRQASTRSSSMPSNSRVVETTN